MRTHRTKIAVVAGFLGLAALLGSTAAAAAGTAVAGMSAEVTHAAPQVMGEP